MKKILILSANPINTEKLRIDEEVREIQDALRSSGNKDKFEIIPRGAVRIEDLRRALLDDKPQIVHFSGHGTKNGSVENNRNMNLERKLTPEYSLLDDNTSQDGIALEDDSGAMQIVSTKSLADLFKLCKNTVQCVLLNACYSEAQAEAIHKYINCVIGMSNSIQDRAAIKFSQGFYDALFAGETYVKAFEFGCNNIDLHNIPEFLTPKIKVKDESAEPVDDKLLCPYRGLFHFRAEDAEFFFGREVFIKELVEATQNRNLIPVLGASGSGKSSVVFAGLVPKLQQAGHWQFTNFRPGADPFHALALALVPFYAPNLNETNQIAQSRELAKYLSDRTFPLSDVFTKIQQNYPNQRLLVIADQFEEPYTLCSDEEVRRHFLDCLLTSIHPTSKSQSPIVLIATMRVDFLGNALSYPPFADLLRNADIKIRSMNREELLQVIEKPASKLGVTFEAGLVERILEDVKDEPGNLPLLEFALTRLWEQRTSRQLTHAAYEAIGEVQGGLTSYADKEYGKLSPTEREQVRQIFIQLVRPGEGTEDTRRLATKAELGEARWSLVKQLADARLVVTGENAKNQETVEVVHEALIRNWGELRQWMAYDRNFRAWQERLRAMMRQWEETQRDEGALLRGVPLLEAQEKLEERQEELSPAEQEFIQQSIEVRDRQEREKEEQVQKLNIALAEAERQSINALCQASEASLLANKQLEALVAAVKAGRRLENPILSDDAAARQIVSAALQRAIYNVQERNRLEGHSNMVKSVVFSSDGQTLASGSDDNTIKLWNVYTGQLINTLNGHSSWVNSVVFSPDGQTLASGSVDNSVKLWDVATSRLINILKGHGSWVNSVVFSPDGQTLASGSGDKTVKLWKVYPNNLNDLMTRSCDWLRGYLQNNPNVSNSDRHLCDRIGTQK